jgi:hypothetical protein
METLKGLIIIVHSGLRQITNAEIVEALPGEYRSVHPEILHLTEDLPLDAAAHIHWESYKARQSEWFQNKLLPKLEAFPEHKILYFGLTHIPLAMHLGFLVEDTRKVEVFLCGYRSGKWTWEKEAGQGKELDWKVEGLPVEEYGGESEAVIRYGVYAPIAEEDTREVVPSASKEVDIQLTTALEDSFEEPRQLELASAHYFHAIRTLSAKMRGVQAIHVFAAVPTGLAFLMGQNISPNKHPWVYIYHYKRTESPRYRLAMILQEEPSLALNLTDDDRSKIHELRDQIADHLKEGIVRFINGLKVNANSWLPNNFPESSIRFDHGKA